jgi:hypothetical protein
MATNAGNLFPNKNGDQPQLLPADLEPQAQRQEYNTLCPMNPYYPHAVGKRRLCSGNHRSPSVGVQARLEPGACGTSGEADYRGL